jgi:DNA-binding CsgD family transcriptional regulator
VEQRGRTEAVVGRPGDVARLESFLETDHAGFTVLTIQGDPGIGKTNLWREGIRVARNRGAVVLVARTTKAETDLSYAGIADLFEPVATEVLDQLPPPQREALATALLRSPAPPLGIDERALFASVLTTLRVVAADREVVVAVDDGQWLDTASARALSFTVRRLEAERVRFLLTVRGHGSAPSFADEADPERRELISLGPLSVGAIHELIKEHTGRSLPRPTVVRIARLSEGNPLYALEVAHDLGNQPPTAGMLRPPANVGELLAARIKQMPSRTRESLLITAILARPTVESVDIETLEPARRAGIVLVEGDRLRFSHPLIASAVYDLADAPQRRSLHHKIAGLMNDPEERARHLALGSEGPDEQIAAELDVAAKLAAARGAPQAGADLVELALGLTPTDDIDGRSRRLRAAARFSFEAGDLVHAEEMLDLALGAEASDQSRAQVLQLLGRLYARGRSFVDARETAVEALTAARLGSWLRPSIELDLAYYCVCSGDFADAKVHAQAAVSGAEEPPPSDLLGHALGVLTMTEFLCGGGVDEARMTRALKLESTTSARVWQMRPTFIRGLLALWTGRVDEAQRALGVLLDQSRERGEESPIPVLSHYLTWAHLWRGDLIGAKSVADEARKTASLLGDPAALGGACTANALVHAYEGSVELARYEGNEAIGYFDQIGWRTGTIWPRWAIGMAELSVRNAAGVETALGCTAVSVGEIGGGDPVLWVFIPDEIEALIDLGQLERARAMLGPFKSCAVKLDRSWARATAGRCEGLLEAAGGQHKEALDALEEALSQHDRAGIPFERARTLLALGRVQRRSAQRGRAAVSLREARGLFEELGAHRWYERADDELSRTGRRTGLPDSLTETERRVAELAASGISNREIAERAFLTTKAVEANLTRVYRKLGIRSRGGLARALDAVGGNLVR